MAIPLPANLPPLNQPGHPNFPVIPTAIVDVQFDALAPDNVSRQLVAKLNTIRANGIVEVGMEANVDAGLQPSQYLQIPLQMVKPNYWVYGVDVPAGAVMHGGESVVWNPTHLYIHDRVFFHVVANQMYPVQFGEYQKVVLEDVVAFVVANWDQTASAPHGQRAVFMAARLASLMLGAGTDLKSLEFVYVAVDLVNAPATAEQVTVATDMIKVENMSKGFMFVAARLLSWAQKKHATGNVTADGIVRKVLSVCHLWPGNNQERIDITTAFYEATHHAGVHVGLSRLCPGLDTWGVFDPRPFFVDNLNVLSSFSKRFVGLVPHGTARVQDCLAVLKELVATRFVFLCNGQAEINSFIVHANHARRYRFQVCESKGWFYQGCPFSDVAARECIPMDWDPTPADSTVIMTEIACYAVLAAPSTTMSVSAALRAQMTQHSTPQRRAFWQAVPALFGTTGSQDVMKMFVSMLLAQRGGGNVSMDLTPVQARVQGTRAVAITDINNTITTLFGSLHLPGAAADYHFNNVTNNVFDALYVRAEAIVQNLEAAAAQAPAP